MIFDLNTKRYGWIRFWLRESRYVFVDIRGRDYQPCAGGGFMGDTLMASERTLERVARRWWRAHLRNSDPE